MNLLEKLLWRWQGRRKLTSDQLALQYTALRKLGEIGNPKDLELLLPYLSSGSQLTRNATALAIKDMIIQQLDTDTITIMQNTVLDHLERSSKLTEKLALIEITGHFPLAIREKLLAPMITTSESDLQYVVISSIEETRDLEILDTVLNASDTQDLVLRRMALQTWYRGISDQPLDNVIDYISPRLHYLVRAVYELNTDGEFLRKATSYAKKSDLPHPKAYPDFMIRYMTELLGRWEYDPDAYRSLHAIMVPSYFTFNQEDSKEQAYVQL
jgi:HEAT repeat protein